MRVRILGGLVAAATVTVLILIAEAAVRLIDGLPLLALTLPQPVVQAGQATGTSRDDADLRHVDAIPLAAGVDRAWYPLNPAPIARKPPKPEVLARLQKYEKNDPIGSLFSWNRLYLTQQLCSGSTLGSMGVLNDFFVFDPPTATEFPIYRHLSDVDVPGWFVTSNFGWRGPDVSLNKPAGTIRIAFVGSSTTIDPYGAEFSHIEYLGHWLNLWMKAKGWPYRVEVINAARTGIAVYSVSAIVEQELAPLEPDLVIYDGANDYRPGLQFKFPPSLSPPGAPSAPWKTESYSAIARRLHNLSRRTENGDEPEKPVLELQWPASVDEQHPDLAAEDLPMDLEAVMKGFDRSRQAIAPVGTFVPTSMIALVHDGLHLQLPRDQGVYDFLNRLNYPITYAQQRRLMDFLNRTYQLYATQNGLPFIDKAAVFPRDPELFADMLHQTPPGLRLKAWIYLQSLAGWLAPAIKSGRLPRAMQHPLDHHPNFPAGQYAIVTRAQVMAGCKH